MSKLEIVSYVILAIVIIADFIDFVWPEIRNRAIYTRTSRDVNFNRK